MTYRTRRTEYLNAMRAILNGPRVRVGAEFTIPDPGCVHTRPRRHPAIA